MYANKSEISKVFGISPSTVYRRIEGIEAEIGRRYNRYAILESNNLVSIEVFADYLKYNKRLADKNLRKSVPPFNMADARAYLVENGLLHVVCKKVRVTN